MATIIMITSPIFKADGTPVLSGKQLDALSDEINGEHI